MTPAEEQVAEPGAAVVTVRRTRGAPVGASKRRDGATGPRANAVDAAMPTVATSGVPQVQPTSLPAVEPIAIARATRPADHRSGADGTCDAAAPAAGSAAVTSAAAPGSAAAVTDGISAGDRRSPDRSTATVAGGTKDGNGSAGAPAADASTGKHDSAAAPPERGRFTLEAASSATIGSAPSPDPESGAALAMSSGASVAVAPLLQTPAPASDMPGARHAQPLPTQDRVSGGASTNAAPEDLAGPGLPGAGQDVEASLTTGGNGGGLSVRVSAGAIGTVEVRIAPAEPDGRAAITIATDKHDTLAAVMSDRFGIHAMLDQAGIETDRSVRYELANPASPTTEDVASWTAGQSSERESGSSARKRWTFRRDSDADGSDDAFLDLRGVVSRPHATQSAEAGYAALDFTT